MSAIGSLPVLGTGLTGSGGAATAGSGGACVISHPSSWSAPSPNPLVERWAAAAVGGQLCAEKDRIVW